MKSILIGFLIGFAAGIAVYRVFIISIIGKPPHTVCDYCKFIIKKKEMFGK